MSAPRRISAATISALGFSICLTAAWLVSNHYLPWLTAQSDLLTAVGIAVLGLVSATQAQRVAVPAPAIFFAAIAAVPLAQFGLGQVRFFGDAWIASLYLCSAAATVIWSAQSGKNDSGRLCHSLAVGIVTAGLASSYLAMVQQWQIDPGFLALHSVTVQPGWPPIANIGQRNHLATLMALSMGSILYLFECRRISAPYALLAVLIFLVTAAATRSRTPLLLFVAAFGWHICIATRAQLRTKKSILIYVGMTWIIVYVGWTQLLEFAGITSLLTDAERLHLGLRRVIWGQMIEAIGLHPWFGYGWHQLSLAQLAVSGEGLNTEATHHAHNLLLDLAIWAGIPLSVLICFSIVVWVAGSLRRIVTIRGAYAALLILLILAHSMVEYPLDYLYLLAPFAVSIGILVSDLGQIPVVSLSARLNRWMVATFVALLLLVAVDYFRVEAAFREMRFAVARIGQANLFALATPLNTQFTQLRALHDFSLQADPHPGMTPAELTFARDVSHRYHQAPLLYRYALAQAMNGDPSGAVKTLKQMRQIYGQTHYAMVKEEIAELGRTQFPQLRSLALP